MGAIDREPESSLISRVRAGDGSALRELYARHAGLVFSTAARIVLREEAEEIVQELFLLLWRKPDAWDPNQGALQAWLARAARNRALNEKRRRSIREESSRSSSSSRVDIEADIAASSGNGEEPKGVADLAAIRDANVPADEALWTAHRQQILCEAVEALPPAQQRAVSLAFFDELPHSEVAHVLGAPLGTVKTRIRLGLRQLAWLASAALALVLLIAFGFVWAGEQSARGRADRALRMVTASDVVPLHLAPAPGMPASAHGGYRARPGSAVAVLTTTLLPPPPEGTRYAGWARHGAHWTSFGELAIAADGHSISIAESPWLVAAPDEVRVTREAAPIPPAGSEGMPSGTAALEWPVP